MEIFRILFSAMCLLAVPLTILAAVWVIVRTFPKSRDNDGTYAPAKFVPHPTDKEMYDPSSEFNSIMDDMDDDRRKGDPFS